MKSLLSKIVMSAAVLALSTGIAFAALTLGSAKQQGLVGEQPDGLLGVVTQTPAADVTALVESVNAGRAEKYRTIAEKNGTELDQVKALAGKNLIQNAPTGEFIMNAAGEWQRK